VGDGAYLLCAVGKDQIGFAKRLGARVIGIHREESRSLTPAAQLADLLLDSRDPELGSVLRAHNAGRGADVVLNAAGGRYLESRLTCLRRGAGRWKLHHLPNAG
jgi:NADPH:quinone reductase-like Zn-dependent oxidoreductase